MKVNNSKKKDVNTTLYIYINVYIYSVYIYIPFHLHMYISVFMFGLFGEERLIDRHWTLLYYWIPPLDDSPMIVSNLPACFL